MKLNPDSMQKIMETAYLSAQNTSVYRSIIRLIYHEKELFRSQLSVEEIHEKLCAYPELAHIILEELKGYLTQLTEWGNLTPMQDPRRVNTIEEYKNKRFRYSLTEYAVRVERMTIELETMFSEGNTLSSSLLVRIAGNLDKVHETSQSDDIVVSEWWYDLQEDFTRLNQNYSDYLHTFYSVKGEKLFDSLEFVIHKDKFVRYLREFIRVLQTQSGIIEKKLMAIDIPQWSALAQKITQSLLALPRTNGVQPTQEALIERVEGQWASLRAWFVSDGDKQSTCEMAMVDCQPKIVQFKFGQRCF